MATTDKPKKITSINEVFNFVKLAPFAAEFTGIEAHGGLYHRMKGKATSNTAKTLGLNSKDKAELKAGLQAFINEVQEVVDNIDTE